MIDVPPAARPMRRLSATAVTRGRKIGDDVPALIERQVRAWRGVTRLPNSTARVVTRLRLDHDRVQAAGERGADDPTSTPHLSPDRYPTARAKSTIRRMRPATPRSMMRAGRGAADGHQDALRPDLAV
jgi:hypothetical protein